MLSCPTLNTIGAIPLGYVDAFCDVVLIIRMVLIYISKTINTRKDLIHAFDEY